MEATIEIQIEKLEQNRKNALNPYQEIQDDRMLRYFNCQDDTILGGISDQVTSATMSRINREFDLAKEQILNGGYLLRSDVEVVLYNLEGVRVSEKVCRGRFGYFFILYDGSFVSTAKKKATFTKKGYSVMVETTTYKCKFTHITDKGHVIYKDIEDYSKEVREYDFDNCHITGDGFEMSHNWIGYLKNNQK
jgi:archaellum component FlaF (FlaF/FlaG flagellin family)